MIEDKFNKIELSSELISELVKKFISDSKGKKSTIAAREYALLYFLQYLKNQKEFYFIPDYIKQYVDFLLTKSKLSAHSARNYISTLNIFCEYLAQCGVIDKNPVKRARRVIKQKVFDLHYITLKQIHHLMLQFQNETNKNYLSYRNTIIPLLMIFHNFEPDQIFNFKVKNVKKNNGAYYIKTNNNLIELSPLLFELIAEYMNFRYQINGKDYLFVSSSKSSKGEKLSFRNLREIAKSFIKHNGFGNSPFRTITNTSILYHYSISNNMEVFDSIFKINNKLTINKYLNEINRFKGE